MRTLVRGGSRRPTRGRDEPLTLELPASTLAHSMTATLDAASASFAAPARWGQRGRAGRGARAGASSGSRGDQRERAPAAPPRGRRRRGARSATRNSGRPDWRVPKKSPGPRTERSASAMREAVVGLRHGARCRRRASADDAAGSAGCSSSCTVRARRGPGAGGAGTGRSARRARSSITDGVGHVDPDLDHGGRDQERGCAPAVNARHHRVLLREAHAAVEQARRAAPGRPPRCSRSAISRGGAQVDHLGLLDQRVHDVGLAARRDLARAGTRRLAAGASLGARHA